MTVQHIAAHRRGAPRQMTGSAGLILPVRLDGEPVTDPAFALPLPVDFVPWEQVVEAYLLTVAAHHHRAAA